MEEEDEIQRQSSACSRQTPHALAEFTVEDEEEVEEEQKEEAEEENQRRSSAVFQYPPCLDVHIRVPGTQVRHFRHHLRLELLPAEARLRRL